jgi:hypothetical protein
MSARGAVLAGRRAAEALQTDACTITRPGAGDGMFDPATGATTPPAPLTVYTGQCRVRMPTIADRERTSGEHQWTLQDAVLSLPADTAGVQEQDSVTITASELDVDLPGTVWAVTAFLRGSQTTARRIVIREVTS